MAAAYFRAAPKQLRTGGAGLFPVLETVEAPIGQAKHVRPQALEQRHAQRPLARVVLAQVGADDGVGGALGQHDAARLRVARPALPTLGPAEGLVDLGFGDDEGRREGLAKFCASLW